VPPAIFLISTFFENAGETPAPQIGRAKLNAWDGCEILNP
jgi:hypothetical protein